MERRKTLKRALAWLAGGVTLLLLAAPAGAVRFQIDYADSPGEGFYDPVLGPARRAALERSAEDRAGFSLFSLSLRLASIWNLHLQRI